MQRLPWLGTVGVIVCCVALLGLSQAMAAAKGHPAAMRQMTGWITAIDAASKTLIIEAPAGQERFTIGGPLSDQAVLKKGGKAATLSDFKVGGQVSRVVPQ